MGALADKALVLLEWYRAMGVDETLAETPQDWFARELQADVSPAPLSGTSAPEIKRKPLERAKAPSPQPPPKLETSAGIMNARELAKSAATLDELRALLETFEGCGLKKTASRLCLSRGSKTARLMDLLAFSPSTR